MKCLYCSLQVLYAMIHFPKYSRAPGIATDTLIISIIVPRLYTFLMDTKIIIHVSSQFYMISFRTLWKVIQIPCNFCGFRV